MYDPDRFKRPVQQSKRSSGDFQTVDWDTAVKVVAKALQEDPQSVAFYLGLAPDHLYDLVSEITSALGTPAPVCFSGLAMVEARRTLEQAAAQVLGTPTLPTSGIANADVVLSFGAKFIETWLSPIAYSQAYEHFRRGRKAVRGDLMQVEPRMSMTASNADRWFPAKPGTEGLVALAVGRLVAEKRGQKPPKAFAQVNPARVAEQAGLQQEDLDLMAESLVRARTPLVILGSGVAGNLNGLEAAQAMLALNAYLGNIGKAGGVFLTPAPPLEEVAENRASTFNEMASLVRPMPRLSPTRPSLPCRPPPRNSPGQRGSRAAPLPHHPSRPDRRLGEGRDPGKRPLPLHRPGRQRLQSRLRRRCATPVHPARGVVRQFAALHHLPRPQPGRRPKGPQPGDLR